MKSTVLTVLLTCAPAIVAAQASASANANVQANAQTSVAVPANFSAESKANIEATVQRARAANMPLQPLRQRIAEGQAKAASDAQIAVAVQRTEARLEASQQAMISAGRKNPTTAEVTAGEQAMAAGATQVQLETLVKRVPMDRPLTLELLTTVSTSATGGGGQANATGAVTGTATTGAQGAASAAGGAAAAAGNAAASVGANAAAGASAGTKGAAGTTAGVTGAVSGAVSGALGPKKP